MIGMLADSNVWMKDVCILGSIARGVGRQQCVVGRSWDTRKHYERYVG